MSVFQKIMKLGVGSAVLIVLTAPAVSAFEFSFSKAFDVGELSGSFAGIDTGDGILTESELTEANFEWTGGGGVPAEVWGLGDLGLFNFSLDPAGDREIVGFKSFFSNELFKDSFIGFAFLDSIEGGSVSMRRVARVVFFENVELTTDTTFIRGIGTKETELEVPLGDVVPTPAAVLPGLLGMGLSAIRRRRIASSEDA